MPSPSPTVSPTPIPPPRSARPGKGRGTPKALSLSAIEAMLATTAGEEPAQIRAAALLELLYATGARISEAVGADLDDLDLETRLVRLYGKGGKERIVPFGSHAAVALGAWVTRVRPTMAEKARSGTPAGALFLNARGTRMSRQTAWKIVGRAGASPDSRRKSPRTRSATRSPRTSSRAGRTSASSRSARPRLGDDDADLHEGVGGNIARGLRHLAPQGAVGLVPARNERWPTE